MSPKWPILCQVGRKTLTQSVSRVLLVIQYKQHTFTDAVAPSITEDASDDSVDIDMEKLKAEAKEVACIVLCCCD